MKNISVIIVLLIFYITSLSATMTRVKSLGDMENPVDGKLSGLIKDDIVDIYFNPAKVNDVKAFLILTSFHLDFGTPGNEVDELYTTTEAVKTNVSLSKTTRSGYDIQLNTGVLIPLSAFNLFINYQPDWNKFYKETSFDSDINDATNVAVTDTEKQITMSRAAFDVTLGFNISDKFLFGLRTGYFNSEHSGYKESGGVKSQKSEFTSDKFVLGSGVGFNFTDTISLSIAGDFTFNQIDESPMKTEEGLPGASTNEINYDPALQLFDYSTTEKENIYALRIYPEINLRQSRFIRILIGGEYSQYTKDYKFNALGDMKETEVTGFDEQKLILSTGLSFNHNLTESTRAIYGLKYTGLVWGNEEKTIYPNKTVRSIYTKSEIDRKDHFIGSFVGFDTQLSRIIFLRTGLSQGLYRNTKQVAKEKNINSGTEKINELESVSYQILPQTVFALGFYMQPVTDLIFELNLSASKDWNMDNISFDKETYKESGSEKERLETSNYDFQVGISVSYKI
ncbi:MAG: hypothetical protein JW827_02410 [Spirochaetes bacterium]|nr:hypothetical protein [Spirochaetota bacterium]